MIDSTLHATPRWRDVVLEQIRIVGLSLRREALVAATVLAIITAVIVVDIVRGNAGSWFDSDEWVQIGVVAFLLPFAVWRNEKRFAPTFFWTLPVERRSLALAKVFAGWVWLISALAFFVALQLVLAFLSGVAGAETVPPIAFSGATASYLFGSALLLGLRHPARWLFGTVGVLFALGFFNQAIELRTDRVDTIFGSGTLLSAVNDAWSAWHALPQPLQSVLATLIPIGAGLLALFVAASRHREHRPRSPG